MTLRIAVLGHIRHPVARPFMGGMEAHCFHLVHGLQARGHDVTLFAAGDSTVDVPLIPVIPEHYDRTMPWADHHGTDRFNAFNDRAWEGVLPGLRDFDVIHNNSLHRFPPRFARAHRRPMVTSFHVPPFDPLGRVANDAAAPWSRFTVCSAAQARAWWPDGPPPEAQVVPNGIDLADWPFRAVPDGSAVWAGRITPNKGTHLAVQAARIAGLPLTIHGHIEDRAYFDRQVAPLLSDSIRYGGHLSGPALAEALGRASVALFTPLWDEPFGLAAIEAMACGTPVAATDMGATAEVIGPAGALAPPDDPAALADAMHRAATLPRTTARARAEQLYTLSAMLDGYEGAYARAIAGLGETRPAPRFDTVALPV